MSSTKILFEVTMIRERVAAMEAKQDAMMDLLRTHNEQSVATRQEVDQIKVDVERGLAQFSLLKWLAATLIALAGATASVLRYVK